jgi:hypothetical protein
VLILMTAILSGTYLFVQLQFAATPATDSAVCLAIAHLVCGRSMDEREQTYDNECLARSAGVISFTDGPCKRHGGGDTR